MNSLNSQRGRRVVIAEPYVPSYSLPFFNGLVSVLGVHDIELVVVHSPELSQALTRGDLELPPWAVAVPAREVTLAGRTFVYRRLPRLARHANLLILEQALGKADGFALLRPFRRRPIAMLGHGHIHNRQTSPAEDYALRQLTRRVDWFFGYTASARADALVAGVAPDRITVFENSTDTASLSRTRESVTQAETNEVRDRYGLGPGPVMLFLGSIDDSKRPDFLVQALGEVWKAHPQASLVLVGEGSSGDRLAGADQRVVRAGRLTGQPLAVLASVSDVIVMPGRVGLVATDSFALEVPIVTTSWRFHSPEFEYLVDGVNATITPDDPVAYASAVNRLLDDADELNRLKTGCRASAQRYSTENMVALFAEGILGALELGPRPNPSVRARVRRLAKSAVSRVGPLRRRMFTSTDYEVGATLEDGAGGWSTAHAVRRQDRAWRTIVDDAINGSPREDVAALWRALDSAPRSRSIVEVGSGHGHNRELIHHHRKDLRYTGLDISYAMCRLARERQPEIPLIVGDAVALPIAIGSVDIVLDAATLMHVPRWRTALREEARAARHQLILHSVTVAEVSSAIEMRKYAYGAQVYEVVLSRRELADELNSAGFRVVDRIPSLDYDLLHHIGVTTASETWVCVKVGE